MIFIYYTQISPSSIRRKSNYEVMSAKLSYTCKRTLNHVDLLVTGYFQDDFISTFCMG